MSKLWDKGYDVDKFLEQFTVGKDYILDMELIPADCAGSMAHARMLEGIGILSKEERKQLENGLKKIVHLHAEGRFSIDPSQEDGHTAIEEFLTETIGEAGKKIHTGRSRNDQVLTAMRLYERSFLLKFFHEIYNLTGLLLNRAGKYENVPMPGRTHMQIAMPSSVGLWLQSYADEILDAVNQLWHVYQLVDRCPLGAAASYGVPIPLDREETACLLGFSKVHRNVLAVNNSRGKTESMVLDVLDQIALTLSKAAQDLILFSLPEFGYFSLPDKLCTGSSIMPQKKNPDGLELVRAKASTVASTAFQIKNCIRSLPSGYNRDFQETKEPFLRGSHAALGIVRIMSITFKNLEVHEQKLRKAFPNEIFATDAAFELVKRGVPFRDAYRQIGENLDFVEIEDPSDLLKKRTSLGTPGNLRLDLSETEEAEGKKRLENEENRVRDTLSELFREEIELFREPGQPLS